MTSGKRAGNVKSTDVDTAGRPRRADASSGGSDRSRATTNGVFHAKAGARSAGGVPVFVQETLRELARSRPACLFTEDGPLTEKLRHSGVNVVWIRPNGLWERFRELAGHFPFNLARLSQQASESNAAFVNAIIDGRISQIERDVDVLFTHNLVETIWLSNVVDVPVVRVLHGCQHVGIGTKATPYLSNEAANVANSRQTARELREKLGRTVDGIVYPGVRTEEFNPERTPAFENDGFVILFVGRFIPTKGVYDLLEAFAELPGEARLRLVGRGDTERLAERIDELDVERRVTIEGAVSHTKLPHYYVAADAVCLPTHYESFGMVNLEAMACGTPVVTSNLPSIREYGTHEETCLLVEPGDTDRLAEQLARLLASPELRERLGDAGQDVAERYTWQESAAELARIGETVLARQ